MKQEEDSDDDAILPKKRPRRSIDSSTPTTTPCSVVLSRLPTSDRSDNVAVKNEPNDEQHSYLEGIEATIKKEPEDVIKTEAPSPSEYTITHSSKDGMQMVIKTSPVPSPNNEQVLDDSGVGISKGSYDMFGSGTVDKFSDISDADDNDVFLTEGSSVCGSNRSVAFTDHLSTAELVKNNRISNINESSIKGKLQAPTSSVTFANQFEEFLRCQNEVKSEQVDSKVDLDQVASTPFRGYSIGNSPLKRNRSGGSVSHHSNSNSDYVLNTSNDENNHVLQVQTSRRSDSDKLSSFGFDSMATEDVETESASSMRDRKRMSSGASDQYSTLASLLIQSDSDTDSPPDLVPSSGGNTNPNEDQPSPIEIDLTDSPPPPDIQNDTENVKNENNRHDNDQNFAGPDINALIPGDLIESSNNMVSLDASSSVIDDNLGVNDGLSLDMSGELDLGQYEMQCAVDSILDLQQDFGYM